MSALAGLDAETALEFAKVIGGEAGGFILQLMAGMDRQSQAMSAAVEDSQRRSTQEAMEAFILLFDAVDALVPALDSMRLSKVIQRFAWQRDFYESLIEEDAGV